MLTKKEKEHIKTLTIIFKDMHNGIVDGKMFLTKVKSN